ncbi:MAG: amidohydrolase family protein [Thaumarchaeota archaeon]|jgi:cytosine/adenosine deaminase-related metal-dependent hydrolase|nr:amidohydrolase family protein [Nitrososphaerota archaeon]
MRSSYRTAELNLLGAFIDDDLHYERGVRIYIQDNAIVDIEKGSEGRAVAVPAIFNSHVHTGDFLFNEAGYSLPLEKLVAPPDGLKHRLLENTDKKSMVSARKRAMKGIMSGGVIAVADFVEGGAAFAMEAKNCMPLSHLVYGRPKREDFESELQKIRLWADGLGIPDAFSYSEDEMEKMRSSFHGRISVHVSETAKSHSSGDFRTAMDSLDPFLLVHGVHFNKREINEIAEKGKSIAVCIRSNMWFSVGLPPLKEMVETGANVVLGTDNVGWIKPDIWREMEAAITLMRGVKEAGRAVLKMATVSPSAVFNFGGPIKKGAKAIMVLMDGRRMGMDLTYEPYYALIKRGGPEMVMRTIGY